jgi:hypothetical protein
MKKSDLKKVAVPALSGIGALMPLAALMMPVSANAALTCTNGTNSTSLTCTATAGDASSYVQSAFNFTGSAGVRMAVSDTSGGVALCGNHVNGTGAQYGLTTNGGSMTVKTGAASATPSASLAAGGCS